MARYKFFAVVTMGLVLGRVFPGTAAAALPPQAESCSMCHTGDADSPPKLRLAGYAGSAHGGLDCAYCHQGADAMPHAEDLPPVDCTQCHSVEVLGIQSSTHGKSMLKRVGGRLVRACLKCHGGTAHSIPRVKDPKSPVSRANQVELCSSCHARDGETPEWVARRKPVETYRKTVHGIATAHGSSQAAICADCHGGHDIRTGADSASKVSRVRIAETCGQCHKKQTVVYNRSVHGRSRAEGVKEAPTCTDCHGEHEMVMVGSEGSRVSSATVSGTCAGCHDSERIVGKLGISVSQVNSYKDSYHGLASRRGGRQTANCSSCHGWHEILPSNDPASTIHPARIAQTCGSCHPGAGDKLGSISVHSGLSGELDASEMAKFFRLFYWILIPLVIGGMLFHNGLDMFRKSIAGDSLPPLKKHADADLLTVSERIQHAGLGISFVVLALTGFALEYPEFCSSSGCFLLGGEEVRRWIHRWAAILFLIVGVYHAGYLLLTARGRKRLFALLPAVRDLFDPIYLTLSNIGLKVKRPVLPRWSYIEKAEYWALIWGSLVMLVTGAVLAFADESLHYLPLWVIESARVIHFLEALLACLAILVWHWYWVIFDPHVYPMNWAWLTGREKWSEKNIFKRGASKDAAQKKEE